MRTIKVTDVDYEFLTNLRSDIQKGTATHIFFHDAVTYIINKTKEENR